MRGTLAITAEKAKVPVAEMGIKNAEMGVIHPVVISVIKGLAKNAAIAGWKFLATALGVGERTAKHRIDGTRRLTADEVGVLLGTEDGCRYLAAIATTWPNLPLWYRLIAPMLDMADAQRMQFAARRKYEKTLRDAVDADRKLAASIEQGKAALLAQDAEFYSDRLGASGDLASGKAALSGVVHRALAKKGGTR